jgi:pyruvate kinase
MLKQLIQAGMNVVRMNFSHGSHEFHGKTIANAREAAKQCGKVDLAIALDTKGPEIRTGKMLNDQEVTLEVGAKVRVSVNTEFADKGTKDILFVDYKNLTKAVTVGSEIYIDDGLISLQVQAIGSDFVDCVVANSGAVSAHKGVNLPYTEVDLPAVSDKDKSDLAFAVQQKLDVVFASFIRSAENVREVRAVLEAAGEHGKNIMIISKIENHEGVKNFDGILEESDGIMVARGDLGIEIPAEKVFVAQKMIISRSNLVGKPVICATQMLESMTVNPRPTRAEVSDVANAVLDGADCVMLSGETAKGKYPVKVVQTMSRICREAQAATQARAVFENLKSCISVPVTVEDSVACSAVASAYDLACKCLVVLSNSGRTARLVCKFQPAVPVICPTANTITCRQLALTRGAIPVLTENNYSSFDKHHMRVCDGVGWAKQQGILMPGDKVIVVHADNSTKGFANLTRVLTVE